MGLTAILWVANGLHWKQGWGVLLHPDLNNIPSWQTYGSEAEERWVRIDYYYYYSQRWIMNVLVAYESSVIVPLKSWFKLFFIARNLKGKTKRQKKKNVVSSFHFEFRDHGDVMSFGCDKHQVDWCPAPAEPQRAGCCVHCEWLLPDTESVCLPMRNSY